MRRFLCLFVLIFVSSLACATAAGLIPGLAAGVRAPDFTAATHTGETIRLSDIYKKAPVVLILYRGGWCYYCNLQLKDYQAHIEQFRDLGARVVAVSVDKQNKAAETVQEKRLDITVVSNPDADILKKYNAIYQVPQELADTYKKKYNIDLQEASGRMDRIIAIPATYVIDRTGRIVFAHSDKDYKNRKKAEEILDVLEDVVHKK